MKKIINLNILLTTFLAAKLFAANPCTECDPPPAKEIKKELTNYTPAAINELSTKISTFSSKVPWMPLSYSRGGDTQVSVEISTKEECCDCEISFISSLKAEGNLPLGTIQAGQRWPIVPGVFALATGSVKVDVSASGELSGDCSDPKPDDLIIKISGNVTGQLKIGLAVVHPDVAEISGTATASGDISAEWGVKSGTKSKKACVGLAASAQISTFVGSIRIWSEKTDGDICL
jgi:hypothetical protein